MVAPTLHSIAQAWWQAKSAFADTLGVTHDLIHVLGGMAGWWLLARISGRPRLALALVTVAAVANEGLDLALERWPDPLQQGIESGWDLILTLLPPLLLTRRRHRQRPHCAGGDPEIV